MVKFQNGNTVFNVQINDVQGGNNKSAKHLTSLLEFKILLGSHSALT